MDKNILNRIKTTLKRNKGLYFITKKAVPIRKLVEKMTQKGLILKIEKDHLIVMTDDQAYVKLQKKNNCHIGQRILFTEEDVFVERVLARESYFMSRKFIAVAASLIMILSLGGVWGLIKNLPETPVDVALDTTEDLTLSTTESLAGTKENTSDPVAVATVMTIDINPSVKLLLDAEDVVISIKAINKDAETLVFDGIVGMKAEDAVERVVDLARAAGFIDIEDLTEDYVLITTVSMNDDDEAENEENIAKLNTLKAKIEAKIENSDSLQEVNVAIIKATKVEMRVAEGKHVPIGLYVAKGKIEVEGEKVTVKEYFSNSEQVKEFENKGVIVDKKDESKIRMANKFLDKLDKHNYDTNNFRAALAAQDADLDAILDEIKAIWGALEGEPEGVTIEPTEEDSEMSEPPHNPNNSNNPNNPNNSNGNSGNAPGKNK